MKARMAILFSAAVVSALAGAAFGQGAAAGASTYMGVIVGQNVNVRAQPHMQGYVVARLNEPARVEVRRQLEDWLEIVPPRGTSVAINRQAVRVGPDGTTGVVLRDATDLYPVDPTGAGRAAQALFPARLSRGTTVTILPSDIPGYWRIQPPAGTSFWVSASLVMRADEYAARASQPTVPTVEPLPALPPVHAVQPVDGAARTPAGDPQPAAQAPAPRTPRLIWEEAETALREEFEKPLDQRDVEGLLRLYRDIPVTEEDQTLHPFVQHRIEFLERTQAHLDSLRQVERIVSEVTDSVREMQLRQSREQTSLPSERPAAPAATGILQPSVLFPGTGATPRRYILRDPVTDRINAYVESRQIDLGAFVGDAVDVHGPGRFDARLNVEIVDAVRVDRLRPASPAPLNLPAIPRPAPVVTPPPTEALGATQTPED